LAMLDRHSRRLSTHRKWLLHQLRLTQAHLVWLCYPANIEFAVNPWIIPLVYIYQYIVIIINISLLFLLNHIFIAISFPTVTGVNCVFTETFSLTSTARRIVVA
jgi:hypothetical protein